MFNIIFNIQKLEPNDLPLPVVINLKERPTPAMGRTEVITIGKALDETTFISIEIS